MADEITLTMGLRVVKDYLKFETGTRTSRLTLSGTRLIRNTQLISTTYEAIVVGDLTTAGYAWFKNLDLTNYVEIGREGAGPLFVGMILLYPGQEAIFPLTALTIFGRANSASVLMDVCILER